ncbi:MAG TPA: ABC transporter ATP-binding protein [Candidatus Limnocylindrales bacterium]|nr:ABC transporter ATP-binding protein [Candidatus Limnocylindrales bacterium]
MGFHGGSGGRFGHFGSGDDRTVPRERRGHTVRRIAAFFRPYRLRVGFVLLTITVTSLLGLINPYLLKLLIDEALPRRDFGLLNLYVGLMIAVPIVSGLIGVGQSYLNNVIGQRVMHDLRNALYAHLQRLPLRFFTETRTGEIQSRLANDVGGVQSVVTDTASSVFANAVIVISTVGAMLLLDWRLTALSLGLLPFFMYLTYRVGKIRRRLAGMTQASLADMSAITEETVSVSGMLLTKTFGQQEQTVGRFRDASARLARLQIRQSMVGRWFFMIVGTVFSITPAFVYWLAGYLAINGDQTAPTIGDIVAFTTLQSRLFFPLGQLLNVQVELHGALALFDRIFEYLEMPPEIADRPTAVALDPERVQGRIRFRHVSFRYRSADPAPVLDTATHNDTGPLSPDDEAFAPAERVPFGIEDVDFEAQPGQLVALVGPSGSGKTTTTYLLPRLYDVDEGAVEIDGTDVRDLRLASLGQVIGFVTQETFLFHASVRENLRYARADASDRDVQAAARMAAIHDRIHDLPQGYDTIVGERGYKLSGGEKQRIALARVLLKDPRILVLDEATSALDTVSERLIQAAMERVMKGRTTIAIAHRLSTILRAELILVFDGGRIIERGRHADLLEQGGLYRQLYEEQFLAATGAEPAPA